MVRAMANNVHTLKALTEWGLAQGPGDHLVYVAQRFIAWHVKNHNPSGFPDARYYDIDLGSGCVLNLEVRRGMARFPFEDYVMTRYWQGPNPVIWTLRRIGKREGQDGFLPEDELVEKQVDYWEIVHWLSDPDRIKWTDVHTLSYELMNWRFTATHLPMEMRIKWDVR